MCSVSLSNAESSLGTSNREMQIDHILSKVYPNHPVLDSNLPNPPCITNPLNSALSFVNISVALKIFSHTP